MELDVIALEESIAVPGLPSAGEALARSPLYDRAATREWVARLADADEMRLADMDAFGIRMQVLSLAAPGIQSIADPAEAVHAASHANNTLAAIVTRHPTRFAAFAALPVQDPVHAARELRRAVTELGMCGALVNGHTFGRYLDAAECRPIWEVLVELDVPLYLHPGAPQQDAWQVLDGFPILRGSTWSWAAETAGHALRIIYSGIFDDFPQAKLVLGHMGEFLPFQMARLDARFRYLNPPKALRRAPSRYIAENIWITTSGVCSHAALIGAVLALGVDRILFAVDYPFESTATAIDFLRTTPLAVGDVTRIAGGTARQLLRISAAPRVRSRDSP